MQVIEQFLEWKLFNEKFEVLFDFFLSFIIFFIFYHFSFIYLACVWITCMKFILLSYLMEILSKKTLMSDQKQTEILHHIENSKLWNKPDRFDLEYNKNSPKRLALNSQVFLKTIFLKATTSTEPSPSFQIKFKIIKQKKILIFNIIYFKIQF